MTRKQKINFTPNYTDILSYQIKSDEYKFDYDAYCTPLYWFVKLYTKHTSLTMGEIERKLHYSSGVLTKKLNINNTQHHALTFNDIEKLCAILNTPLSSILFLYERRHIIEQSKCPFDKLTNLMSMEFKKVLNLSRFSQDLEQEALSKSTIFSSTSENSILESWCGKWFFYFPSSDSKIITKRKKNLTKHSCPVLNNADLQELYDLYSTDHIYSGVLHIEKKENRYFIHLKYLTNPNEQTILQYDGQAIIPPSKHAIFSTLTSTEDNDIMYLIIDTISLEKRSKYIMASVLSLSRNVSELHLRPCALRMILSRDVIEPTSPTYNVMIANLMMNDNIIRIDENGYGELKKHQNHYNSPALNIFLERYPNIDVIKKESININVQNCAYIDEATLHKINGVTEEETLYLKALLRLHSIAPWYSKINAAKTNNILDKIS